MSGILRGGEMLMVIGKPGSGCTTFLKTIANMREEYEAVGGDVWYNGVDAKTMKARRPDGVAFAGKYLSSATLSALLNFMIRRMDGLHKGEGNRRRR
jgi:ABC-type multidrug transport system ATPase subunit